MSVKEKSKEWIYWVIGIAIICVIAYWPKNSDEHIEGDLTAVYSSTPMVGSYTSRCPYGCSDQIEGCDIKGNISIDTGEKIYHLPGDEYYSRTKINPAYGERWFCTEAEARANGWRHSFK